MHGGIPVGCNAQPVGAVPAVWGYGCERPVDWDGDLEGVLGWFEARPWVGTPHFLHFFCSNCQMNAKKNACLAFDLFDNALLDFFVFCYALLCAMLDIFIVNDLLDF